MTPSARQETENYQETLDQLVKGRGSQTLPSLKHEKDPLEKTLSALQQKTDSTLGRFTSPTFYQVLGITFIVLAIAALLYFLYKKRVWKLAQWPATEAKPATSLLSREHYFLEKIEEALRVKNLSKAARLRWKLFLYRLRLSAETTPQELENGSGDEASFLQKTDPSWNQKQYQLMFAGKEAGATYQELHTVFESFEQTQPEKS